MTTQTESHTHLNGKWLLVARLAWAAMFAVLTVMYALGFLAARDALSTVCKEELCTLNKQIRHTDAGEKIVSWPGPPIGYADRLRSDQVETLERLGLTLNQYGWLGALQMGLPVLVYLLIAAGLFWWKSDDWMVLFASIMVATIPIGNGPLPFMLMVRQPTWEWVFDSVSVVALSCFLIFPLIFPTGRFVPRWTRWIALFEIVGAIIITLFSNPILATPRTKSLVIVYLLISFGTGVYAQLYRYFRMASPVERQQLKWVVVGLAGFIGIAFAALLPLNALLTSQAAGMDPVRALILSAIPDTMFQVILLFIPVSIAISVLRYRLWDIDIFINRSLVYGALTASVVGLYALIVGGLGALLQMQNNLPSIVMAVLLIAFIFQPMRQRLQYIVDHFVPVPRASINQSTLAPQTNQDQKVAVADRAPGNILRGRWLILARMIWIALACLIVGLIIAAFPALLQQLLHDSYDFSIVSALSKIGLSANFYVAYSLALEIVRVVGFMSVAIIIFWRKSDDWMALFTSLMLLLLVPVWSFPYSSLTLLSEARLGWDFALGSLEMMSLGSFVLFLFLFPDGRMIPRWTRFLAAWILTWPFIHSLSRATWDSLTYFVYLVLFGTGLLAQIYRYRYFSGPVERQQTKWVVYGFTITTLVSFAIILPSLFKLTVNSVMAFASLLMPISIGISILRYRLWDIDIFINRSLVYGALIVSVIGLYIIVVGVAGALFQSVGNTLLAILATGLIAVLFHPLRQRLQRGINHLLYGERDEPYTALARLGRRLESTLAPEAVLPTVVTTVRDVLKLPYVAIYLQQDSHGYKIVAESASPSLPIEGGRIQVPGMEREGRCIPLIHQGETLGYIVLGPRSPNEAFSSTDLHLLDDIAPQVGVAVHAVRLTADLQRSRERLVMAREEERRRLRRDLHDDLAPTLASLGLTASTAADLIPTNPEMASALIKELQTEIRATVGSIRRLVYDLRPPTLDELGLLAAVRERATQYSNAPDGFHITVDAPTELSALPAAVEVAAYRIVQEALENVSKHSRARRCAIRFANHNGLEIEIMDDGIGLPLNITPGVGLRSMHERAEELGGRCVIERGVSGGTRVLACLPIGDSHGSVTRIDRR